MGASTASEIEGELELLLFFLWIAMLLLLQDLFQRIWIQIQVKAATTNLVRSSSRDNYRYKKAWFFETTVERYMIS